ncbi:molybdopterin-dependent oxidoreductase [Motilibacter deserti]|uniref:Molybdopterin-dependent oxidoreductase n=1 Tax=Motilibacter deserti TaxID=2714956 RepID=A0ABX0GP44_9ACTN|nr:molybdopterin-dependent oxidoreductase [Motilibacter deserti]NHC12487.1 molybdopterin-dependent oxidoreductase [Motilibacter deserti]
MRNPIDLPLTPPPDTSRVGPFREGFFRSPVHRPRTAAVVGRALGLALLVCLVTGVFSHFVQHPPGGQAWPSRPVQLYRVTQGLHVAAGIAVIPLLLAKLWVVYPRLFGWPPFRTVRDVAERLSVLVLIGAASFEVVSGLLNTLQWYPWAFFFPAAHYEVAWLLLGAVLLHLAVKWPVIAAALGRHRAAEPREDALSRRRFLWGVTGAVGAVTVATVGQTVAPLERLAVLAPRRPSVGPQGLPVNRTSRQAHVERAALDPGWRLEVRGPRPASLTLEELRALPQHAATLPIACVEGWSASGRWSGVRLRDLLELVGAPAGAEVRAVSLEREGNYRESLVQRHHAADPLTLVALDLEGEPLHLEHGFPARLIAPNRPGVLQTKWLARLEVL